MVAESTISNSIPEQAATELSVELRRTKYTVCRPSDTPRTREKKICLFN